jgi:hypothetical protein
MNSNKAVKKKERNEKVNKEKRGKIDHRLLSAVTVKKRQDLRI